MARIASPPETPTPIGQSPAFLDMLAHVSAAAPLSRPVLVIGARGTGKELVASRLAMLSPRWDGPLIKINCAALPETLLDSELFGHEAGAFTGAQRRRPGRFELADGGTLFLDEIATASLAVQEKLLRVLEYGAFERVGGSETLHTDVRIVAATNVHLPDLVLAGKFRADLLDRLSFDVITVPPLAARREDILVLATHFAERFTRELDRPPFPGFTAAAIAQLEAHPWPGNVRELRNVAERSVYRMDNPRAKLARLVLDPFASPWQPQGAAVAGAAGGAAAPAASAMPAPASSGGATAAPPAEAQVSLPAEGFEAATRAYAAGLLKAALHAARFNQAEAARRLGLTYYQLRHHLRTHNMLGDRSEA